MTDSQTENTSPAETDGSADAGISTLDRRRDKMQTAKSRASVAATAMDSLDQQLTANAELHSGQEGDLQATLDRVATLKKSIKVSAKNRQRLLTARKTARRDAATSRQRADTAEAKYDKAVLADMVRREKDHDLSAHSDDAHNTAGAADGSGGTATASANGRARTTTARVPRTSSARATARAATAGGPAGRRSSTTTRPRTESAAGTEGDQTGSGSGGSE